MVSLLHHVCVCQPRCYCIYSDLFFCKFFCSRFRQRNHRALRSGIYKLSFIAPQSCHRGNIHDASTACLTAHNTANNLKHIDRSIYIHGEHFLHIFMTNHANQLIEFNPCIVHQTINMPADFLYPHHSIHDCFFIRNIKIKWVYFTFHIFFVLFRPFLYRALSCCSCVYYRTILSKNLADSLSNSSAATGHYTYFSCKHSTPPVSEPNLP